MHPARMKPAVRNSSVLSVARLSLFSVSITWPNSSGGAREISFNIIIVAIVDINKAACCLQAVLMKVCIGDAYSCSRELSSFAVWRRNRWGATWHPFLIRLKRSSPGI